MASSLGLCPTHGVIRQDVDVHLQGLNVCGARWLHSKLFVATLPHDLCHGEGGGEEHAPSKDAQLGQKSASNSFLRYEADAPQAPSRLLRRAHAGMPLPEAQLRIGPEEHLGAVQDVVLGFQLVRQALNAQHVHRQRGVVGVDPHSDVSHVDARAVSLAVLLEVVHDVQHERLLFLNRIAAWLPRGGHVQQGDRRAESVCVAEGRKHPDEIVLLDPVQLSDHARVDKN
eukprot:scaffold340_cov256-Pinguiococcus_pyrenoidosus.AAC.5